jgi:simple sugar transport system ATP-binding protein
MISEYAIATPGPHVPVRLLSGGNIQRLILARELSGRPALVVASHPTAGLDVSATEQTHALLLRHRREDVAILLVSEDLDEILKLSDRIAVLFSGEIVGLLPAGDATRERLGLMMMGQRA